MAKVAQVIFTYRGATVDPIILTTARDSFEAYVMARKIDPTAQYLKREVVWTEVPDAPLPTPQGDGATTADLDAAVLD